MSKAAAWWQGAVPPPPGLFDLVFWNTSRELQAYNFDGSDLTPVGNATPATSLATADRGGVADLTGDGVIVSGSDGFSAKAIAKYQFDGSDWALVGNINTTNPNTFIFPAYMGAATAAILDFTQLRYYGFDGADWTESGTSLPLAQGSVAERSADSVTTVSSTHNLSVNTWGGSSWTTTKTTALGFTAVDHCAMTATRVAILDTTNNQLKAYDEGVSNFSQVGNALTISGLGVGCVTALSASRVAVGDVTAGTITIYDFDGTDFTQVGNALSVAVPEGSNLAGAYHVF